MAPSCQTNNKPIRQASRNEQMRAPAGAVAVPTPRRRSPGGAAPFATYNFCCALRHAPHTTYHRTAVAGLLGCLLASACEQPAQQRPDAPVTDGQAAHHFDAATLAVGDTFLGLRVVRSDVRRVFEDSVWSGTVAFSGPIEVTGVFQPHFDYPEIDRLCFHVVDPMMIRRIPEFAPDRWTSPNGKTWFCFTNADEVLRLLGTGEPPRHATIVIDDYHQVREFTDAWDTARLVRVVTLGGPATRTLRE